ncbi:MAG: hypothetical protein INR70_04360 [Parafilimonas terrae]|nr:hypothetical protein [Parafilimonas terrae]
MPISAARMKLYPGGSIRSPEWLALRGEILGRAGDRCEGTPQFPECRAANGEPHPETRSKVVLTIAHMDQDPGYNDPANLRALCQRCHNAWDRPHRAVNASRTRHLRAGQPDLFPRMPEARA